MNLVVPGQFPDQVQQGRDTPVLLAGAETGGDQTDPQRLCHSSGSGWLAICSVISPLKNWLRITRIRCGFPAIHTPDFEVLASIGSGTAIGVKEFTTQMGFQVKKARHVLTCLIDTGVEAVPWRRVHNASSHGPATDQGMRSLVSV